MTEEDEDEVVEEVNEVSKLQAELDEHRDVVKYLREKLNEVNFTFKIIIHQQTFPWIWIIQ